MKNQLLSSHLKLHIVVLIYGFTAILGKLITLSAFDLVWYRMLIALVSFGLFLQWKKTSIRIPSGEVFKLIGIGLLVALHWIAFFGAIKLANVSVALGCLATSTLFTSLMEPFFFRKRINLVEVIIGVVIIGGLYLIFRFETRYSLGLLVALAAAMLAGLFSILNKKMIARNKAAVISFYEMFGGWLGITLWMLFQNKGIWMVGIPTSADWIYLLLLGVVCTAFAFAVQVGLMTHLSAFVVSLAINLEPVYGILIAYFLFGDSEQMSGGFYTGTAIILLSVLGFPLYHYYRKKRETPEAWNVIQID